MSKKDKSITPETVGLAMTVINFIAGLFGRSPEKRYLRAVDAWQDRYDAFTFPIVDALFAGTVEEETANAIMDRWVEDNPHPRREDFTK